MLCGETGFRPYREYGRFCSSRQAVCWVWAAGSGRPSAGCGFSVSFVFEAFPWSSDLCQRYATRVCDLAVISPAVQLLKSFLFSLRSNPCSYSLGMKPGAHEQLHEVNRSKHAFRSLSCTFRFSGLSFRSLAGIRGSICPALLCASPCGIWGEAVARQRE